MNTVQSERGALSDRNVLELLMEWHREKRSGCITVARKSIEKKIFLRQGSILRAQSNQDKDKLGQILIKKNLISPWDLEVAISQVKDNQKRLGQVLLGMSALKEPVLNNTLVSQTRDIIFSTVDWEDGEYTIEEYDDFDGEIQFEQLFTPEIILQGVRRISNIVLLLRPLGDLQGRLKLSQDYLERIRKITLLTEEKSVLALLHRPSSLKDLLKNSGMEKIMVYRSVAALLAVGILTQEPPTQDESLNNSGAIQLDAMRGVSDSSPTAAARSKGGRKQLGEMLVEARVISEEQLKEALKTQTGGKGKKPFLGSILVGLNYATEEAIIEGLSSQLNIKKVDVINASEDAQKLIPVHLAKKYLVCPIGKSGSILEVAMLDPTNMAALDDLSFVTGYRIKPMITTNKALKEAWEKIYGIKEEKGVEKSEKRDEPTKRDISFRDFAKEKDEETVEGIGREEFEMEGAFHFDVNEIESLVSGVVGQLEVVSEDGAPQPETAVSDAPIVKLVDTILKQAINTGASDIHIEPWETKLQVRFRLDGTMHKVMSFPSSISSSLVSRVKILSKMDIAERRRPQDGRVKMKMGRKRTVDYRVSCVPTVWGERIVMRVLDQASLQIDMTKLGFDQKQLGEFRKAIDAPYGMLLVTGPTGSGKTTTLYSALASLDCTSMNILTAEDPVEYNFPGIAQVQINDVVGVTFANVLRSFLRQDPDVILVGEIRDAETAEICAKAALTGHLVLSTVHTNDAPSAIGRLIDLGLKPYLVSACLNMVIAQRLLRKVCSHCKIENPIDKRLLIDAGFTEEEAETVVPMIGKGCDDCNNSGFYGRCGIYEIMSVTRRIKGAVAADLPSDQIKDIAVSEGMKDLRRAALEKVIAGVTSLEEAIQNTMTE